MFRWVTITFVLLLGLVPVVTPVLAADQTLQQRGIEKPEEYLSPQFDNQVVWTADWEVDAENLDSDSAQMIDTLSLHYKNQATFQVRFIEAGGESPEAYAERLVRYRNVVDDAAEVVLDEGQEDGYVLLYTFEVNGEPVYSVIEIRLVNRNQTLQVTELVVYPDVAKQVFRRVQRDIVVDGTKPFQYFKAFPAEEFMDAAA